MNEDQEDKTKTGAVIIKKPIPKSHVFEYEAVLFITSIPLEVSDEELQASLKYFIEQRLASTSVDWIVRADINATSKEIYEQFKGLNNDADKSKVIDYKEINSIAF